MDYILSINLSRTFQILLRLNGIANCYTVSLSNAAHLLWLVLHFYFPKSAIHSGYSHEKGEATLLCNFSLPRFCYCTSNVPDKISFTYPFAYAAKSFRLIFPLVHAPLYTPISSNCSNKASRIPARYASKGFF